MFNTIRSSKKLERACQVCSAHMQCLLEVWQKTTPASWKFRGLSAQALTFKCFKTSEHYISRVTVILNWHKYFWKSGFVRKCCELKLIPHRQNDWHEEILAKQQSSSVHTAFSQSDKEYILLHNQVFLSGRYNFEGCRIPLKSNLNIDYFRCMLYGYKDEAICDFLEFGFPLGYVGKIQHQNPKSYNCHCLCNLHLKNT